MAGKGKSFGDAGKGGGREREREGVTVGEVPERLYREVRALRIYEGATEIQYLVIARELRKSHLPAQEA